MNTTSPKSSNQQENSHNRTQLDMDLNLNMNVTVSSQERIKRALTLASTYGSTDGAHHKMWLIDQMVRALTGCHLTPDHSINAIGEHVISDLESDSPEYENFLRDTTAGEDGPNTYSWDQGISP